VSQQAFYAASIQNSVLCGTSDWLPLAHFLQEQEDWSEKEEYFLVVNLQDVENLMPDQ
jgi:hypothetical protein